MQRINYYVYRERYYLFIKKNRTNTGHSSLWRLQIQKTHLAIIWGQSCTMVKQLRNNNKPTLWSQVHPIKILNFKIDIAFQWAIERYFYSKLFEKIMQKSQIWLMRMGGRGEQEWRDYQLFYPTFSEIQSSLFPLVGVRIDAGTMALA